MYKLYQIEKVEVINDELVIVIDRKKHAFKIADISDRLFKASKEEREEFIVSPSGYGIHWPKIDEDISIHGLMMKE